MGTNFDTIVQETYTVFHIILNDFLQSTLNNGGILSSQTNTKVVLFDETLYLCPSTKTYNTVVN